MCGIVGMYGFTDEKLLKGMADSIGHRGPDGEGFFIGSKGGLGSRRLAIIDVAGGGMPISNEDATKWIVYNGEIYNYLALSETLKSLRHNFKSHSDTEMVLHAYEQWGVSCVEKFNGMFAFAIYDVSKNEVFAARDQFGIKPFYYCKVTEGYLFSSEIKAFLKASSFRALPNNRMVFRFLKHRKHDDLNETFFEGVNKLLPGEYALFSEDTIRVNRYFNTENLYQKRETNHASEKENLQKFRELFIKSVKDRLMSEVPVGSCLSGGLDSSSIVCVINDELLKTNLEDSQIGDKQKTFSAVFPKEINDEQNYINEILEKTKTEKNFVYPNSKDLFEELRNFVYAQEEPTISSGPYSQWCVMRQASKKIKVLLDGQGADEVLAGYNPYLVVYLRQLLSQLKIGLFLKEFIGSLPQIRSLVLDKLKFNFSGSLKEKDLINKEFAHKYLGEVVRVEKKDLKKRFHDDLFLDSVPALLRYEDKNSMAFSIEGRVPFLDIDLINFIFSLPNDLIIRHGCGKYVLRQALKDLLPKNIAERKWKVGFTTPEIAWFKSQKEKVYEIIDSETFKSRPYFNYTNVKTFVDGFYEGKHEESMVIWRFINVEIWLRVFVDKKASS